MRKLLTLCAAFALLLGIASLLPAQTVSMPSVNALPGSVIYIPVNTTQIPGQNVQSFQTTIDYDPSIAIADTYITSIAYGSYPVNLTILPDTWWPLYNMDDIGNIYGGAIMTDEPYLSGAGALSHFIFYILPTASGTVHPLTFASFTYNTSSAAVSPGNIAIVSPTQVTGSATLFGQSNHEGITVGFFAENGGMLDTAYTTVNGNYSLPMASGTYTIVFYYQNYSLGVLEGQVISGSSTVINPVVLGVSSVPGSDIPTRFALSQNYPNPFNPATSISFDLAKSGEVNLIVYNLMGEEVAVLQNGYLSAGSYKTTFSGADLPSGIYFCRLTAGDFTSTQKMLLTK